MTLSTGRRAAIYARVSTLDQEPENQLAELRRYVAARGWTGVEFVDRGVSGAKDRRPALDWLIRDAKLRKFDILVCWRLGRSLKHLVTLLDELQVLGVAFVSLEICPWAVSRTPKPVKSRLCPAISIGAGVVSETGKVS